MVPEASAFLLTDPLGHVADRVVPSRNPGPVRRSQVVGSMQSDTSRRLAVGSFRFRGGWAVHGICFEGLGDYVAGG